jgi:hypothetical protein
MKINLGGLTRFAWPTVVVVLVVAVAGVYLWQHGQVSHLNSQVSTLDTKLHQTKLDLSSAQQQAATLQTQAASKKKTPMTPSTPASCQAASMKLSLGAPNGTAGTSYVDAIFTNTSSVACTLQGYPEANLADSNNQSLGQQASQSSSSPGALVTVQPNHQAHAALGFPDSGALSPGSCSQATYLNVTLPGDSSVLQTTISQQYCPGFSVSAIEPGS